MDDNLVQFVTGFYGVDKALSRPLPGDFILTHGSDWPSFAIRFGQALRFRGKDKPYTYWNHAALVVSEDGTLVEALGKGVVTSPLSKYTQKEYVVVRVRSTSEDRKQMVAFGNSALGRRYGWLEIVSLSLSLLTGLKFNFGVDDEVVCSGLVAGAMERGYDIFERQCSFMTPADLAKHYNIIPPTKTPDTKKSLSEKLDSLAEHASTDILFVIVASLLAIVVVLALAFFHPNPGAPESGSSLYMGRVDHITTSRR